MSDVIDTQKTEFDYKGKRLKCQVSILDDVSSAEVFYEDLISGADGVIIESFIGSPLDPDEVPEEYGNVKDDDLVLYRRNETFQAMRFEEARQTGIPVLAFLSNECTDDWLEYLTSVYNGEIYKVVIETFDEHGDSTRLAELCGLESDSAYEVFNNIVKGDISDVDIIEDPV